MLIVTAAFHETGEEADYPDQLREVAKEARRRLNLTERQRLLEEAGKTEADITPAMEDAIRHSEKLREESNRFASEAL
jgi:hypothetical protein